MDTDQLFTLVSSELVFLLTRSRDIVSAFKTTAQRTSGEQMRVERGLVRSLVLEAVMFVPASAVLVILLTPLLGSQMLFGLFDGVSHRRATYALLGVMSYGFPFATVKQIASRMALSTLKEFASIHHQSADLKLQKVPKADGE